jgi:type IV pilus assembly protein PilV
MPTDFRKDFARGITLIEVLVTIVILAVGILGLAGLQASGLRVGQGAMYRGIAAQFAEDMADRMRANAVAASLNQYDRAVADPIPTDTDPVSTDVADWLIRMHAALPGAGGSIAVTGNLAKIVVQWDDRRASVKENNPQAGTAKFELWTQFWSD